MSAASESASESAFENAKPPDAKALPSRFWAELATPDFAALDPATTVAVLPLGATEQHGPHLPLCVDTRLADGIVAAALPQLPADLPVLFLPTQAIGFSPEHIDFAGTLSLSAETLLALWKDMAAGVARAGVKKLILFNAHGGHVGPMDVAAREMRMAHGLVVYSVSWFNLPMAEANAQFSADEHRFGVHGGEIETAMMLALDAATDSGLVRMAAAQNFDSTSRQRAADYPILGNGRSAKLAWAMQDYNRAGAAGNAAAATAEKGQAVIDAAATQLALLLAEVSRLPLSMVASAAR